MRHSDPELIERLAAEYVLGTLRGAARARFARWAGTEEDVARAVRRWEDRLADLDRAAPAQSPPAHVWPEIARRIGARPDSSAAAVIATLPARRGRAARPLIALALAASLTLLVVAGWLYLRSPAVQAAWQAAAELRPADAPRAAWRIEFDAATRELRISAEQPLAPPPQGAHELWALRAGNAPPVSLGVLPPAGRKLVRLTPTQLAALAAAGKLAVSEEPAGGSPTGLPTGRVVLVAPRNALRFET